MSKEKLSVWETLSRIDCSKYVEKKGMFDFLPWVWAWSILKENYPKAKFEYIKTENGKTAFKDEEGYAFVRVAVTVEEETVEEDLAVMDNNNNDIQNPKPTQINNSLKRCLVKAIAFHGLGINVYAGEDTVMFEDELKLTEDCRKELVKAIRSHMDKDTKWAGAVFGHWDLTDVDEFSDEQLVATHERIPTQEKK
jgi:hypothetical protein